MHSTEEASETAFLCLEKSVKKLRQMMGEHIAKGVINPMCGVCSKPDKNNHFDVYEYSGNFFEKTFSVIKKIP